LDDMRLSVKLSPRTRYREPVDSVEQKLLSLVREFVIFGFENR